MMAVIEYRATANFKGSRLKINKIREAIITTGVAPK
jgi:hypothetical protein